MDYMLDPPDDDVYDGDVEDDHDELGDDDPSYYAYDENETAADAASRWQNSRGY